MTKLYSVHAFITLRTAVSTRCLITRISESLRERNYARLSANKFSFNVFSLVFSRVFRMFRVNNTWDHVITCVLYTYIYLYLIYYIHARNSYQNTEDEQ